MNKEIKAGWTWQYISLTVVLSVLTGVSGYLLKYWLEPDESPDYFLLNRPYLEPRLARVGNATNVSSFFTIRNNGKLPAHDLSFAYVCPWLSGGEGTPPTPKELAPGGEMDFPIPHVPSIAESTGGRCVLYAMYSTQVRGKTRCFRDRFDFDLVADRDSTTSSYVLANREETSTSIHDLMDLIGIPQKLENDVGSYLFWFETPTDELETPMLLFSSKTKALLYHPLSKTLTLNKRLTASTNLAWAATLPAGSNRWHHVGITWSNENISLYIDGGGPGRLPTEIPSLQGLEPIRTSPTTGSSVP